MPLMPPVRTMLCCLAAAGAAVIGLAACTDEPLTAKEPPVDADPGQLLLREYGCTSCHQVPGLAVPQGQVGPPLTDFAERRAIAGIVPHTPENAVRWISDPKAMNPDTLMPDLGVSEADAAAIVAYLYSLDD